MVTQVSAREGILATPRCLPTREAPLPESTGTQAAVWLGQRPCENTDSPEELVLWEPRRNARDMRVS